MKNAVGYVADIKERLIMRKLKHCIVCGGELSKVAYLGKLYPSKFVTNIKEKEKYEQVETFINWCDTCKNMQSPYVDEGENLFRDYYYNSGINSSMRASLLDIVQSQHAQDTYMMEDGDFTWLDIACNDGTMCQQIKDEYGCFVIGVDPAKVNHKGSDVFINDFFSIKTVNDGISAAMGGPQFFKFNIISCIAMMYDIEKIHDFINDVKSLLKEDGTFIVQLMDLESRLKTYAVDDICFHPDDNIRTENGLKKIFNVELGEKVLTHTGMYKKINRVFTNHFSGDLVEIKVYGHSSSIRATPNHPVACWENGSIVYKKAKDLKINDICLIPVNNENTDKDSIDFESTKSGIAKETKITNIKVDQNLMKVIGYYLSEGSTNTTSNNFIQFSFNENELEYHEDLILALTNLGFKANKVMRPENHVLNIVSYGPIVKFLKENFGHLAQNKYIPQWVKNLPSKKLYHLLEAYKNGDGYDYRDNKYWRCGSVSKQLAHDIAEIANKIGFKCSLNEQNYEGKSGGLIKGREIFHNHNCWDILIHVKPEKKQKVWLEDNYQKCRVKSISEFEYTGPVYNLEIDEDNTYTMENMLVHNCFEHIVCYSLYCLKNLFKKHGLEIYDCEYNKTNCSSLRIYIGFPGKHEVKDNVDQMILFQSEGLTKESMMAWEERLGQKLQTFTNYLNKVKSEGKKLYLIGASTKASTLLQLCDITNNLIDYALERSSFKFGKIMMESNIPIVSEDEHFSRPTTSRNNEVYVLAIWAFKDNILKNYSKYIEEGATIVVPFPTPHYINKGGEFNI